MSSIHDYSDILRLPRPEPKFHHRMPLADRAAQFSPFAALTGFFGVIEETGRTTDKKLTLDEREKERINKQLNYLNSRISSHPKVKITYFIPDTKKEGGQYVTTCSSAKKINEYENCIILDNGVKINFDDIRNIERV